MTTYCVWIWLPCCSRRWRSPGGRQPQLSLAPRGSGRPRRGGDSHLQPLAGTSGWSHSGDGGGEAWSFWSLWGWMLKQTCQPYLAMLNYSIVIFTWLIGIIQTGLWVPVRGDTALLSDRLRLMLVCSCFLLLPFLRAGARGPCVACSWIQMRWRGDDGMVRNCLLPP